MDLTSTYVKGKNHPTIKDMQAARRVIDIFGTQYKTPCVCEGFDLVFTIPPYCIPSTPPVAETLVTDETTLPPPTSTSPSIPNPPLIYSPSSILAILNNFTLAAQYPYRPKRLDVLPLDPRHAAAAPLTPSSQSSQLVRTWRPSGNGSGEEEDVGMASVVEELKNMKVEAHSGEVDVDAAAMATEEMSGLKDLGEGDHRRTQLRSRTRVRSIEVAVAAMEGELLLVVVDLQI
ncbi:hypothetical protein FRB97_009093 [Tulasnella sp. 331]|nr:hypothetical protein FRB97_009093 [Tulasnella sp. 331]